MRDIARVAGVSQSTVSRVLNDAATTVPIARDPRTREPAARELGYRPNPLARGLRGASTMLIGAVVRDFSDPFFAGAIEALAVEAMARGYNVVLGHAQGRLDEAIAADRRCSRPATPTRIVLLGDMQDQPRLMDDLRGSTVPVVALWQGSSPLEFPTADAGRPRRHPRRAGRTSSARPRADRVRQRPPARATSGSGRTRTSSSWASASAGSRTATSERVPNTLAGGEAALRELFALPSRRPRSCTSTDLVAIGVLHAAHSLGADRPDAAVGRRLRRHPDRRAHGARADDAADADHRDRPRTASSWPSTSPATRRSAREPPSSVRADAHRP